VVPIAVLLFVFVCIGLIARRFDGRVHALLIAAVIVLVVYELIALSRL
jgi:hypothetical protein